MKKSIIPLLSFALMFALAALNSAFISQKTEGAQDMLYWYAVSYENNDDGQIESPSDIRFGGVARTPSYADMNDGCAGSGEHCLRGFAAPLSTNPAVYPITSTGAQQTLKTP